MAGIIHIFIERCNLNPTDTHCDIHFRSLNQRLVFRLEWQTWCIGIHLRAAFTVEPKDKMLIR